MKSAKAKQVVIKSNIKERLSLSLLNVLQGNLKELPDENYKKLRHSILKHGFFIPLFVWEEPKTGTVYLVDGTQRFIALNLMKDEGYKIPQLPVIFIPAANMNEAKEKLALIASRYGEFTKEGVEEFFSGVDFDFKSIQIPFLKFPELKTEKKHEEKIVEVEAHQRDMNKEKDEEPKHECPNCGYDLSDKPKVLLRKKS